MANALDDFFSSLKQRQTGLLMLDYDGTLAPFRSDRMKAVPAPGVRQRLRSILDSGKTRIVFISGRPAQEVRQLLGLEPGLEVWGCHGREHLKPDGSLEWAGLPPRTQELLTSFRSQALYRLPEACVELKAGCLAFHWRALHEEQRKGLMPTARSLWERFARQGGLELHPFDGGLEVSLPGRDKGEVIREILASERGDPPPAAAFLGDDRTDEDGFRALGGQGLSVLVRNQERPTAAQARIGMPRGLIDFLDRWIAATCSEAEP